MERVFTHVSMGDALFFIHELQRIDHALMPLIGDLKEIRKVKLKNQLEHLRKEINVPLSHYESIVFEGNLQLNGAVKILNQGSVLILNQNNEIPQLDQQRFKWVQDVKTPIQLVDVKHQLITLKKENE